ncbi:MAG TPA: hypothetical protein VJB66_03650 [Candidatus Nanoarchaeia archaeon]|nr:hypothetical protein [Candidatus Nanoarchaeia archaeon]
MDYIDDVVEQLHNAAIETPGADYYMTAVSNFLNPPQSHQRSDIVPALIKYYKRNDVIERVVADDHIWMKITAGIISAIAAPTAIAAHMRGDATLRNGAAIVAIITGLYLIYSIFDTMMEQENQRFFIHDYLKDEKHVQTRLEQMETQLRRDSAIYNKRPKPRPDQ